jgi:hypothetical protein
MPLPTRDYSDFAGCNELARRIRDYWKRRGKFPAVHVSKAYTRTCRTAVPCVSYYIESDMVNGLPV